MMFTKSALFCIFLSSGVSASGFDQNAPANSSEAVKQIAEQMWNAGYRENYAAKYLAGDITKNFQHVGIVRKEIQQDVLIELRRMEMDSTSLSTTVINVVLFLNSLIILANFVANLAKVKQDVADSVEIPSWLSFLATHSYLYQFQWAFVMIELLLLLVESLIIVDQLPFCFVTIILFMRVYESIILYIRTMEGSFDEFDGGSDSVLHTVDIDAYVKRSHRGSLRKSLSASELSGIVAGQHTSAIKKSVSASELRGFDTDTGSEYDTIDLSDGPPSSRGSSDATTNINAVIDFDPLRQQSLCERLEEFLFFPFQNIRVDIRNEQFWISSVLILAEVYYLAFGNDIMMLCIVLLLAVSAAKFVLHATPGHADATPGVPVNRVRAAKFVLDAMPGDFNAHLQRKVASVSL